MYRVNLKFAKVGGGEETMRASKTEASASFSLLVEQTCENKPKDKERVAQIAAAH